MQQLWMLSSVRWVTTIGHLSHTPVWKFTCESESFAPQSPPQSALNPTSLLLRSQCNIQPVHYLASLPSSKLSSISWMSSAVTAGVISNSRKLLHTSPMGEVEGEFTPEGSTVGILAFSVKPHRARTCCRAGFGQFPKSRVWFGKLAAITRWCVKSVIKSGKWSFF